MADDPYAEVAWHPLFRYLDNADYWPSTANTVSLRESLNLSFATLSIGARRLFDQALWRRMGDPTRALHKRTRALELASFLPVGILTRSLARRQILDDIGDLFGWSDTPEAKVSLEFVTRLRCLREMGCAKSISFWKNVYLLCGSPSGLIVFTALYESDPAQALAWLGTYVSPEERRRILEKTLPSLREKGSLEDRNALDTFVKGESEPRAGGIRPQFVSWSDAVEAVLDGSAYVEEAKSGIIRYLRENALERIRPEIERQEQHVRSIVEAAIEKWGEGASGYDPSVELRLMRLLRDYQSPLSLAAVVRRMQAVLLTGTQLQGPPASTAPDLGTALLDSLQWHDRVVEILRARSVSHRAEHERAAAAAALEDLKDVLRKATAYPEWSHRALRELVRHSGTDEEQADYLVALLSHDVAWEDCVEDLDHRIGSEGFQRVIKLTLERQHLALHLRDRLARLLSWCKAVYTLRDNLVPGSGWRQGAVDKEPLFTESASYLDFEEPSVLLDRAVHSVAWAEAEV